MSSGQNQAAPPCTCPACTGQLQGNNECDRVLEVRLLDDPRLSDLFAILSDRSIPPPMPTPGRTWKCRREAA